MRVLEIGLVNNMPDSALEATERQFVSLLNEAAANDISLRLTSYKLPNVPRSERGQRYVESHRTLGELLTKSLDGIIVTGAEPLAANLTDESYWADLTRLSDWAMQNTSSAVWSCLAAHAAVLHLDGIRRCRLPEKRFGVFEFSRLGDHFLTAGAPQRLRFPHSRWNDLNEAELKAAGYEILTRSEEAGVDSFTKQGKSLFVFLQGHPEYEVNTLVLEYRRDIKRFLRRESEVYPRNPQNYSHPAWTAFRERAMSARREETFDEFPETSGEALTTAVWRSNAVRVYRNWLSCLARRMEQTSEPKSDCVL